MLLFQFLFYLSQQFLKFCCAVPWLPRFWPQLNVVWRSLALGGRLGFRKFDIRKVLMCHKRTVVAAVVWKDNEVRSKSYCSVWTNQVCFWTRQYYWKLLIMIQNIDKFILKNKLESNILFNNILTFIFWSFWAFWNFLGIFHLEMLVFILRKTSHKLKQLLVLRVSNFFLMSFLILFLKNFFFISNATFVRILCIKAKIVLFFT